MGLMRLIYDDAVGAGRGAAWLCRKGSPGGASRLRRRVRLRLDPAYGFEGYASRHDQATLYVLHAMTKNKTWIAMKKTAMT